MDFDIIDTAPEHKSGIAYASRGGFDELRATFEEFKSANDERLGALERKRSDVLLEEKVDRINAALDLQTKRMDEMALRQARPALEGRGKLVSEAAAREHKSQRNRGAALASPSERKPCDEVARIHAAETTGMSDPIAPLRAPTLAQGHRKFRARRCDRHICTRLSRCATVRAGSGHGKRARVRHRGIHRRGWRRWRR